MKQNKNKKKWTAAAASLAIIAALAGTFAWFTSKDEATNHFETNKAGNDTEIVETFTPPKEWVPGQSVTKKVAVQNSGNYNSLIRVSFTELMDRLRSGDIQIVDASKLATDAKAGFVPFKYNGDVAGENGFTKSKSPVITATDSDGKSYTLNIVEKLNASSASTGSKYQYQAYWVGSDGENYYAKTGSLNRSADNTVTIERPEGPQFKLYDAERLNPSPSADWRTDPYNPTFSPDGSGNATITSALGSDGDKIELNFTNLSAAPTTGKWTYNSSDGYFYYIGVVEAGAQTPLLLESVTLNSNAGNEYGDMKYDLTVVSEGIQAYKAAVDSDQWLNGTNNAIKSALEGLPNLDVPEI